MIDSKQPPIVVIGATRGTGLIVAQELIRAGHPLVVVARNPGKARTLLGEKVSVFEVDLGVPGAARDAALDGALRGSAGIIFTAAVPPGLAREATIQAVDFGGVVATLESALRVGFTGRLVYLTTMGVHKRNWLVGLLDILKWNILHWRKEVEHALTKSGLDAVVIRAGILTDEPGGADLDVAVGDRPVTLSRKISRADVAKLLLEALKQSPPQRDISVFAKKVAFDHA